MKTPDHDRVTMRLVVVIACALFFGCAWFLSVHKRILFLLAALSLVLFPSNALASCTTHLVTLGNGQQQLCTTCCSNGVCNTHCF